MITSKNNNSIQKKLPLSNEISFNQLCEDPTSLS